MDSEKIEKILDKIRKLFALSSNNPSEHEAAGAAEMAKELLEKYNLKISDVEMQEIIEKEIQFETYRIQSYRGWLARIISETFDTMCYEAKSRYNQTSKLVFVGTKVDVEISLYVYQYLLNIIQKLINKKIKENTSSIHGKTIRHNYTMGIISTLKTRLEVFYGRQKEEHKEEKGVTGMTGKEIVVVKNDAIQKYLKATGMKLRDKHSAHNIMNQDAYADGVNDGNNINLSKGINGNNKETTGYLN